MAQKFINVSNHPVCPPPPKEGWSDAQRSAAEDFGFGPPMDLPGGFPNVPPEATTEEVEVLARTLRDKIVLHDPGVVFVSGEFTLCYALVRLLQLMDIPCVTATTRREVEEQVQPDGSIRKVSVFNFVAWRRYPLV